MDLVPRPTNLRGGVQKASEGGGPIAPEDTTLDEMCEVYINMISLASTGVNDSPGKRSYKTCKDQFVPTWRKRRIRPSCTRVFVGQLGNGIGRVSSE